MRQLTIVLAALMLAACGKDSPTQSSDACAQELSAAYTNYGTPTNRVENGAETDLYWGRVKREYIRQGANSCFVSDPIQT